MFGLAFLRLIFLAYFFSPSWALYSAFELKDEMMDAQGRMTIIYHLSLLLVHPFPIMTGSQSQIFIHLCRINQPLCTSPMLCLSTFHHFSLSHFLPISPKRIRWWMENEWPSYINPPNPLPLSSALSPSPSFFFQSFPYHLLFQTTLSPILILGKMITLVESHKSSILSKHHQ